MSLTIISSVLVGLLIGSFLNVCIYRMPRKKSIVWPASHCPACGAPIHPFDNVPLVSYLWLSGRCRACRGRIPLKYPVVEALNGLGYGVIVWYFGLEWQAIVYAALFSALLVAALIDLEHQIIPDAITLPGIALGLICAATVLPLALTDAILGLFLGGGILWGLAVASPYLFGKEGMGGGDVKLLAMIGAFLGWKSTVLTIMIGALAGAVVGIALILLNIMRRDQYLPFGPFLVLGALISMFFQQELFAWYAGFLSPTQ
jgi:leader peptidase (prepilin peptidase) / N-methyltransferase